MASKGRVLPQDGDRLWRWLSELHRGEKVTLDSLDLPAIRHIAEAVGVAPVAEDLPTQPPEPGGKG